MRNVHMCICENTIHGKAFGQLPDAKVSFEVGLKSRGQRKVSYSNALTRQARCLVIEKSLDPLNIHITSTSFADVQSSQRSLLI